MNIRFALLFLMFISCSSGNEYQPVLDAYFSKTPGYEPGTLRMLDTVTLDEQRSSLLSRLRIYHPNDTVTINTLQRHHDVYIEVCTAGALSEYECKEKFRRIREDMIKAFAQLATIDSLESLIGGFDKDQIHDIRAMYKFKIGTDTFNYLILFDGNKNIISADKK